MRPSPGGAKLLLSYDVDLENADTYYRFFLGHYIPTMQTLGLEVSEAWHTAYGNLPNRLVGFISGDVERVRLLPANETWVRLNEELQEYVTGLQVKIVPYREGFQI